MNSLIAKPVVKNQFWIVTDGEKKVGNVTATDTGFEVKVNGGTSFFESTKMIKDIVFLQNKPNKPKSESPSFSEYPTTSAVFNSVLDVKRKLHLYTKTVKSKCYHAAGWFVVTQGASVTLEFCPKYIFIQRYEYSGPYKTKEEATSALNILL